MRRLSEGRKEEELGNNAPFLAPLAEPILLLSPQPWLPQLLSGQVLATEQRPSWAGCARDAPHPTPQALRAVRALFLSHIYTRFVARIPPVPQGQLLHFL